MGFVGGVAGRLDFTGDLGIGVVIAMKESRFDPIQKIV